MKSYDEESTFCPSSYREGSGGPEEITTMGKQMWWRRDGKAEDGFRAAHRVRGDVRIRLRQDPPVTADRVTDPKRSVLRGTGEEKWYHGHEGSSSGAYY